MEAELIRAYYRSLGQNLTTDAFIIEFEVDGEIYTNELQDTGWGYHVPALNFLGFVGRKPSEAEDGEFHFENQKIPVKWSDQMGKYWIQNAVMMFGQQNLKESEWFDPDGEVWNGTGSSPSIQINPDPGTGNRAGVPVEGEE